MGLNITAYQGLCFALDADQNGGEGFFSIYINPRFKLRALDLPDPCVCSKAQDIFKFRPGSYLIYGHWRSRLAEFARESSQARIKAAPPSGSDRSRDPFSELIYFPDCDGAMGPEASAKLFNDFTALREQAGAYGERIARDNNFIELYDQFTRAFSMAAQGGAVSFH